MAVPQITIRLSSASKIEFEQYARKLGLDASELAKLLIVRERHQRRLSALAAAGLLSKKGRRPTGVSTRLPTVTAHMASVEEVEDFDDYAGHCGMNRNGAGAWLLESELTERWLEKAMINL